MSSASLHMRSSAGQVTSGCKRLSRNVVASAMPKDANAISPRLLDRRSLFLGGASVLAAGVLPCVPAFAEEEAAAVTPKPASASSIVYEDPIDKFNIVVPAGWASGEGAISGGTGYQGATGARRTVAFFPDDPSVHDVNVTVVITNVSVEFTKLGSFGNIDAFAGNLINSLDRSYLLKSRRPPSEPIQIAKLVDYKSTGDTYNVEYTVQLLPGPQRHLMSTVILGSNGRYNRLYTITGQCLEDDLPKFKPALEAAVKSFKAELKPMFA